MPLLSDRVNNIHDTVTKKYIFDNRVTWRGSLVGKKMFSNIGIIGGLSAKAVLHAINHERTLALDIHPVPGWTQ